MVRSTQRREKEIERAQAAALQLLVQRLDPDADPRRQRAAASAFATSSAADCAKPILFLVGPVAEAILEIDAEVLDRLARELVDDAQVDAIGQAGDPGPSAPASAAGVGRVLLQRAQRQRAELLRGVGLEQVRAAVDGVHRLPRGRIAGKLLGDAHVRLVERIEKRGQRGLRNRGIGHDAGSIIPHLLR